MTQIYGTVLEVEEKPVMSYLSTAASDTDTDIDVVTCAVFPDTGQLMLDRGTAVEETVTYTSLDRDTKVVTLSAGLTYDHDIDAPVEVYPLQRNRFAWVRWGDHESVRLTVPYAMRDKLPVGIRNDVAGEGETVLIQLDDFPVIIDIPSRRPTINASYIDTTTFEATPSDGVAPTSSPTPTVLGGVGYLAVKWTGVENVDPVTYEVHVSTSDDFTPDANTLAGEVNGTLFFIRELPSGTDLFYDTTYYVKLIAKDEDGSASAGTQGSAEMVEATTEDIAVDAITANEILAGSVTAEKLESVLNIVNQLIAGDPDAQRVEIDAEGVRLIQADDSLSVNLPTDSGQQAYFEGGASMGSLTASNVQLQGVDNYISEAAELRLSGGSGIADPGGAPTLALAVDFETICLGISSSTRRNLQFTSTGGAGGASDAYWFIDDYAQAVEVLASDLTTSNRTYFSFTGYYALFGATKLGSHVYLVYRDTTDIRVRKLLNSDLSTVTDVAITSSVGGSANYSAYFAITNDGTDIYVAYKNLSDNTLKWGRFNTSIAHQATTTSDYISATTVFPTGAEYANAGDGDRLWFADTGTIDTHSFNTSGVEQDDEGFWRAGPSLAWDGTQFISLGIYYLYWHTNWTWGPDDSNVYWVAYSWYDSDTTGGTHESLVSPASSITMKKRVKLRVTTASPPDNGETDDPDSIKVYMNRGTTMPTGGTPTRFSGYLQATGSAGQRLFDLESFDNSTAIFSRVDALLGVEVAETVRTGIDAVLDFLEEPAGLPENLGTTEFVASTGVGAITTESDDLYLGPDPTNPTYLELTDGDGYFYIDTEGDLYWRAGVGETANFISDDGMTELEIGDNGLILTGETKIYTSGSWGSINGTYDNISGISGSRSRLVPTGNSIFTGIDWDYYNLSGEGRLLWLHNQSATYSITLKHDNSGSDAANRFYCPGGVDYVLDPYGSVLLVYDTLPDRWLVISERERGDWDVIRQSTADETVTNSTTLTDHTQLQFPVTAGETWYIELLLTCTGSNTTGDIDVELATTGTWVTTRSNYMGTHYGASGTLTNITRAAVVSTTTVLAAASATGGLTVNNGDTLSRPVHVQAWVTVDGSGTVSVKFANTSASSGYASTIERGSVLRAKRMSY